MGMATIWLPCPCGRVYLPTPTRANNCSNPFVSEGGKGTTLDTNNAHIFHGIIFSASSSLFTANLDISMSVDQTLTKKIINSQYGYECHVSSPNNGMVYSTCPSNLQFPRPSNSTHILYMNLPKHRLPQIRMVYQSYPQNISSHSGR